MRAAGAALLLALFAGCRSGPRPVVVLEEYDTGFRGGVDTVRFVLYDDGRAVFLAKEDPSVPRYASAVLAEAERAEILALARAAEPEAGAYDLHLMPHLLDVRLHLFRRGRGAVVAVYGNLGASGDDRAEAPPAFLAAYDRLRGFRHPAAAPWNPEAVVVMVDTVNAYDEPAPSWPEGWPAIGDASARVDAYGWTELRLPIERLPEVAALQHPFNRPSAVTMGGRRVGFAYRLAFPGEEAWINPSCGPLQEAARDR